MKRKDKELFKRLEKENLFAKENAAFFFENVILQQIKQSNNFIVRQNYFRILTKFYDGEIKFIDFYFVDEHIFILVFDSLTLVHNIKRVIIQQNSNNKNYIFIDNKQFDLSEGIIIY